MQSITVFTDTLYIIFILCYKFLIAKNLKYTIKSIDFYLLNLSRHTNQKNQLVIYTEKKAPFDIIKFP